MGGVCGPQIRPLRTWCPCSRDGIGFPQSFAAARALGDSEKQNETTNWKKTHTGNGCAPVEPMRSFAWGTRRKHKEKRFEKKRGAARELIPRNQRQLPSVGGNHLLAVNSRNPRMSLSMFSARSRAEGRSHGSLNIWLVLEQYGTKMTNHRW